MNGSEDEEQCPKMITHDYTWTNEKIKTGLTYLAGLCSCLHNS